MNLTDGRITLRPPVGADAPAVGAAVQRSLAELAPWMPWATADYGEADADMFALLATDEALTTARPIAPVLPRR